MLLFELPETGQDHAARVSDGMRVYAIGDLHGRVDLLRRLHAMIRADVEEIRTGILPAHFVVIYLGDYFDRGDYCRSLIDLLLDDPLEKFTAFHIRGNHDQMALDFLDDAETGSNWIFNGGDATLRGYGVDIEDPAFGQQGWQWVQSEFRKNLPASHLLFLKSLVSAHSIADYFFSHAGVRPGVALAKQSAQDLMWIRQEFLDSSEDFGKTVVHGHSIVDDVTVLANRIAIDTGAWHSGKLSCLVLEQDKRHVIHT